MFVTAKAPHTLQNMKRELSLADLEVSVAEPEQQPAIDAVVHKLLAGPGLCSQTSRTPQPQPTGSHCAAWIAALLPPAWLC